MLTALACLLNLPVPLLIQGLVDRVVAEPAGVGLPAYALGPARRLRRAGGGRRWRTPRSIGRVGQGVVRDLRHALYDRLQRLGLAYYDRTPAGAIISRLMDDVADLQALVTGQTLAILTDLGTTLAVSALLLARQRPARGWSLLVLVGLRRHVPLLHAADPRGERARSASGSTRSSATSRSGSTAPGGQGVRPRGGRDRRLRRPDRRDAHGPRVRVGRLGAAFSNLSAALSGIGTAVGVRGRGVRGAARADDARRGRLDGGAGRPALRPGGAAGRPGLRLRAGRRQRRPAGRDPRPGARRRRAGRARVPIGRARGLVEFDRVGFGYEPGQPVVWDVRLRVEPGMKVALVGPTGCGKSTLMNLLLRFYDPTWGEIRLDGVPLRPPGDGRPPPPDRRGPPGARSSSAGALADNIRYGAPDADDARVEAAARAALVHGFAAALPDGLRDARRRGGPQAQPGGAAAAGDRPGPLQGPGPGRARRGDQLARHRGRGADPGGAGATCSAGRTAFIIAHRLSTVVDADLIVVMEGARRPDRGRTTSCWPTQAGLYRRLCARQFGEPGRSAGRPAARRSGRPRPAAAPSWPSPLGRRLDPCGRPPAWTSPTPPPSRPTPPGPASAGSRPSSSAARPAVLALALVGHARPVAPGLPVPLLQGWVAGPAVLALDAAGGTSAADRGAAARLGDRAGAWPATVACHLGRLAWAGR